MKIVFDHQLVKALVRDPAPLLQHPLVAGEIVFGWPSFLEYLGLDLLLPTIDETHPLFEAAVVTLHTNAEPDALFYIYDNLFAVSLAQVKTHPQISAPFLLHALQTQRKKASLASAEPLLSSILDHYEKRFSDHPHETMHDLVLYLAWDRMCITMGRFFDYQSADPNFHHGLTVLKQCLIESFDHITRQKRTSPSLYRLLEALVFYEMREERLQTHTPDEWEILAQALPTLKHQDELPDFLYIDDKEGHSTHYLTLDSPEEVNLRLAFVQHMTNKLKEQIPEWNYLHKPKKVTSLNL